MLVPICWFRKKPYGLLLVLLIVQNHYFFLVENLGFVVFLASSCWENLRTTTFRFSYVSFLGRAPVSHRKRPRARRAERQGEHLGLRGQKARDVSGADEFRREESGDSEAGCPCQR